MKELMIIVFLSFVPFLGTSQFISKYPDIPRIDVHTHVYNNYNDIGNYLDMRNFMLENINVDLALWLNLGAEASIDTITKVSKGRIMTCISDYSPHTGLTHTPADISQAMKKGYASYKIWHGPANRRLKDGEEGIMYIDNPAHAPVLAAMEKEGMPLASVHIADPNGPFGNRGNWAEDPVEYWRQITGFERILQRHPDLVVVAAHMAWLVCQDAQIDYLRYLLSTYPNLYVDLAATFQYFYLVNHANLHDFIVEFADRLLYGTDIGRLSNESAIPGTAEKYARTFRILETDQMVEGGFFGMNPVKGFALPREILEKIYYKNALKIYPGLKYRMISLGYNTL